MAKTGVFVCAVLGCSLLASGGAFAASSTPAVAQDTAATQSQSDARITHEVRSRLASQGNDLANQVHVATRNGVVTLSGYVYTGVAAQKALSEAQGTDGVVRVKNELHVRM